MTNPPLQKGEAPKRQWSRRRGGCPATPEGHGKFVIAVRERCPTAKVSRIGNTTPWRFHDRGRETAAPFD